MKYTSFLLSSCFASAYASTNFMVIPSGEQYAEITSPNTVCPSAERMEDTIGMMLSFAAEDCIEMEAPELKDQVSSLVPIKQNGLNGIFSGAGNWNTRRQLDDTRPSRRELSGVDCVNDCYALKKNAPPICCYVCSWCVGGSGRRRLASTTTSLEAEFNMVRAMPRTIECMEKRLDDHCKIELASDPDKVGCYGCSSDGTFTATLGGFVTFTGAEMESAEETAV